MIEIVMNIILNCSYFKHKLGKNGFWDSTVSNTPIVIYNLKQFDYIPIKFKAKNIKQYIRTKPRI